VADVTIKNEFEETRVVDEGALQFFTNHGWKRVEAPQPEKPQSPASTKTKE
jgi:hypothetical protein